MKKLFVVLTMLAAMMLGMGTASAESTLPPCPTEDSDNCTWNAQEQGNGQGRSFTVVEGVVTYWDAGTDTATEPEPVPTHTCGQVLPNGFIVGDRSQCGEVPVQPEPAPAVTTEPVPVAPPVEPVPAPVEVQPVPAPVPMPEGTEERVAAGTELAYTGTEDAALAGIAASILSGGVALVWLARRMRKA